jgi:hypothetical protein
MEARQQRDGRTRGRCFGYQQPRIGSGLNVLDAVRREAAGFRSNHRCAAVTRWMVRRAVPHLDSGSGPRDAEACGVVFWLAATASVAVEFLPRGRRRLGLSRRRRVARRTGVLGCAGLF